MKKVTIVAVGKLKEKFFESAAAEYIKRLSKFCDLSIVELGDCPNDSVRRESEAVLGVLGAGKGRVWLLDVGGEDMTSPEFSRALDKEFLSGAVTFVIGGSSGVSDEVRAVAHKRLSLGSLTYPHQLARVMLLEQIYRAFAITAGLPYHK